MQSELSHFVSGLREAHWLPVLEFLFSLFGIALGVLLGAQLSIRTYFRQREHDVLERRYLVETVDRLAELIEGCLQAHRDNWRQAIGRLHVWKQIGRAEAALDQRPYERTTSAAVNMTLIYRLERLVGNTFLTKPVQSLVAFCNTTEDFLVNDFQGCIEHKEAISESVEADVLRSFSERLLALDEEAQRFYRLPMSLDLFAKKIEQQERLSHAFLASLKKDPEILKEIEMLQVHFADLGSLTEPTDDPQ